MNAERLLTHYDRIADAPDAIPRLRSFILELAARGKLLPQDPTDEPASALLKQISVERGRAAGTKARVTPARQSVALRADIPFDVPAGWVWSSIGEICSKTGSGSTPHGGKDAYRAAGIVFLRSQNIHNSGLELGDVAYIDAATHERMSGTAVRPRDLLLNITGGSIGRCSRVPDEFVDANVSQHVAIIRVAVDGVQEFLHRLILSPFFQAFVLGEQTGAGRGGLPKNRMDAIPVPLPPLAEQRRIVAKVDGLMAFCDRLDTARNRREATRDRLAVASLARLNAPTANRVVFSAHTRFALGNLDAFTTRHDHVKRLRQTILNLAVRGKLVPQDPNDEPALERLRAIATERARLVENAIGRAKPVDPIEPSELAFEVPVNWAWSRIGDAVLITQYGTSQKSHQGSTGVPVLTMGNIQDGKVVWDGNEKRIPGSTDELPELYLRRHDILYNRTNSAELVGKTGIYLGDNDRMTFASYLIRIRTSEASVCPRYLNMAMNTSEFRATQIAPLIKQQTGQANVNGSALRNMMVPIPPLAEQRRIVAKVDELIELCGCLQATLSTADAARRRLLDALLAEALASRT